MGINSQNYNNSAKQVVLIIKLVEAENFSGNQIHQTFMVNVNNLVRVRMQLKFMPKDPRLIKILVLIHRNSATVQQRKYQGELGIKFECE